ncbi:excinuclease ABC subunit UvrB [Spiroplasma endosymbiont of Aspidapion aeneum]|uniref:excinuclease ABC subunit UvrB n=1 Tax=Spiroplasma endosymbiont of Aspidapion aeneum TaxID=3066276 RepID=UPI00313C76B1
MVDSKFKMISKHQPAGDQPKAIEKLYKGILDNKKHQVLLGATGTGKTFTIANIIKKYNKQALILSPNKTLAMQLYLELKNLFPSNKVEYFVSNFDFYQPEAFIAAKDLYIGKDAKRNNDLEMMRLSTLNSLTTRKDTIVVSSVAGIYALENPDDYSRINYEINLNKKIDLKEILRFLITTGYTSTEEPYPGSFIRRGEVLNIYPGHSDRYYYRITFFGDLVEDISIMQPLNNNIKEKINKLILFPASTYVTDYSKVNIVCDNIEKELKDRINFFLENNKIIEADRIKKRTNYDIELLREFGMCSGIENYSSHLEFRKPGEPPSCLFDYFEDEFLTIIDESHIMIPQIRGMYNTTISRLNSLIDYGFRLPSARDNRPLFFNEFENKVSKIIYMSATPGDYELEKTNSEYVEQIIRPTGLLDPEIEIRSTENQMEDIINEIHKTVNNKEKVLITALTIKMAEEISDFLAQRGIKVSYLHSELKTIERAEVIYNLRKNIFDVVVGINLLREGLDIPEVSLVCILDADKNGFLRDTRSLIQIVGRAARNRNGRVIFYAYNITQSMKGAIDETQRRRNIQIEYNKKHNVIPQTIDKEVTKIFSNDRLEEKLKILRGKKVKKFIRDKEIKELRIEMLKASNELDFEKAAELRDIIIELENQ